jgi:hypothetical protein
VREGVKDNGFFGVCPIIDIDHEWSRTSVRIKLDSLKFKIGASYTREWLQSFCWRYEKEGDITIAS